MNHTGTCCTRSSARQEEGETCCLEESARCYLWLREGRQTAPLLYFCRPDPREQTSGRELWNKHHKGGTGPGIGAEYGLAPGSFT